MKIEDLNRLWGETLRSPTATADQFEGLAQAIVDVYASGELRFKQHIKNRFDRVSERTGMTLHPANFGAEAARAFIADELGFTSWDETIHALSDQKERPILFLYAIAVMNRGDFTALGSAIGSERFYDQIVTWYESGIFRSEQETLDEILTAACMLGQVEAANYLLDRGVDPYAGMKTGLAGFHYAASSGRLEVVKLLIDRGVPMDVRNMYGGTVFEQAIWSAVNEFNPLHAEIVEHLVEAGAIVDYGYLEWWNVQDVPDAATKKRITDVLKRRDEFHKRISDAEEQVTAAEAGGSRQAIADALKHLGNILRRPPFLRDAANMAYERAAALYNESGLPLEESWVKRHIGINNEYAGRLEDAERFYDEALSLYRHNATENSLDYANTVRYPAVIKDRLGKRDESVTLWEEACRRYDDIGVPVGVAEAAAHLTNFAIDSGDLELASKCLAQAESAASAANDSDTDKFITNVRTRLDQQWKENK